MIPNKNIGDNLKDLRFKSGLSQTKLCEELRELGCDIIRSTYEKYETGELNVKVTVLAALKNLYGCKWDDFFKDVLD